MARLVITINMDNSAFEPDAIPEVLSILNDVMDSVDDGILINGVTETVLADSNGNIVGSLMIEGSDV